MFFLWILGIGELAPVWSDFAFKDSIRFFKEENSFFLDLCNLLGCFGIKLGVFMDLCALRVLVSDYDFLFFYGY